MAFKKLNLSVRGLLVIIPFVFILASVISNCGNGVTNCDGDVNISDPTECANYQAIEGCATAVVSNGVCNVTGCQNCEVIVDDTDPVIDDIDDADWPF